MRPIAVFIGFILGAALLAGGPGNTGEFRATRRCGLDL
jgi:hypothetical protein